MLFGTEQWLSAWVATTNADERFRAAGAGWHGSVGLVVKDVPVGDIYMRLDGADGSWTSYELGRQAALVEGSLFTLSADRATWRDVLTQHVNPVRALIVGRVRVRGQLSAVLRRITALTIMVELAATLDPDYGDDAG